MNIAATVSAAGGVIGALGTVTTLGWLVFDKVRADRAGLRLQAEKQAAWAARGGIDTGNSFRTSVRFANRSDQPIYNAVMYLVWVQGAAFRTGEDAERFCRADTFEIGRIRALAHTVPPGLWRTELAGPPDSPKQGQLGVEFAFTDAAGRHWVRRTSGVLEELVADPLTHFDIGKPLQYAVLQAGN